MIIKENTQMLFFRYNNYKNTRFIEEHIDVLKDNGYVWMLKVGKRSSIEKLKKIQDAGGWLILRSPKADGSKNYIARYVEFEETSPKDMAFPEYYDQILDDETGLSDGYGETSYQWFKLVLLKEMNDEDSHKLVLSKNGVPVDDVIGTTRTAVMFIKNSSSIWA